MTEVVAATVIAFGVLVSLYVNYLAWSWVLGVRRQSRIRRLSDPDESPPAGGDVPHQREDASVDAPR